MTMTVTSRRKKKKKKQQQQYQQRQRHTGPVSGSDAGAAVSVAPSLPASESSEPLAGPFVLLASCCDSGCCAPRL